MLNFNVNAAGSKKYWKKVNYLKISCVCFEEGHDCEMENYKSGDVTDVAQIDVPFLDLK